MAEAAGRAPNARLLLDWQVPSARHSYTRRDTALYALSVGVGHDALDAHQRSLVDPWSSSFRALPTMALVLGYPGFWLGDDAVRMRCGITPAQILHAEQIVQLHGSLPVEAEVIGETSVLGLEDKGERGALLHSRRVVRTVSGKLLATLTQTHFLRGCGGCGSHGQAPDSVPVASEGVPHHVIELTTRPEQALLYRLNGDANPLHIDPELAREAGFPRPILHGMGTMGVLGHALVKSLCRNDPDRLATMRLRMKAPVLPGETLRIEIWNSGAFRAQSVERDILVVDSGHATCH